MDIRIEKVSNAAELKKFIDFPHDLYADDPNYVPELLITQKKLFSEKKNPFFIQSTTEYWLAYKGDKICGRIALINNVRNSRINKENCAFFGFFDVENDYSIAEMLLNKAVQWSDQHGFESLRGPVNFSTNDTCGLLIDGFDSPPAIMMTYQKEYHKEFLERFNFEKKMDLLSYYLEPGKVNERYLDLNRRLEERLRKSGITIRNISMRNFKSEISKVREVYNSSWEDNWGFISMTDEEFAFAAADMKAIVDEDFAYIAEHNGKPVGFSLTIPNLNEIIIKLKRGRLLPFGWFTLLSNRKKIKSVRVITLGLIESYRKLGIDACFYARTIEAARRKNIEWAEASWILENNTMMNRALENIGGSVYKKYRIYEKAI